MLQAMDWFQKGLDVLALLYVILVFPVPVFWLIIHRGIHFWRRFGTRSFWVAAPVWVVLGTILVLLRHEILGRRWDRDAPTWMLGFAFVALGVWITRRVHREFSLRRLAGFPEINPGRYPGGVVRAGIYAHLRHPRYLAFMLTFVGLAFLTGAVGIFVLAIITILLYLIVAPLEEQELREQYGAEYEAYAREVSRFVPRLRRKTKPPIPL